MLGAISRMLGGAKTQDTNIPAPSGHMPVIVKASAVEAAASDFYAPIMGVIDYVNTLTGPGNYFRPEMTGAAMQAYHADYYVSQVNNGGHSQFIHNAGANLAATIDDVAACFAALDAPAYLRIVQDMADWVAKNPGEADMQTGFEGGRAKVLDQLDDAFFKLNQGERTVQHVLSEWILALPSLHVVPDEAYPAAMQQLIDANPNGPFRDRVRSIAAHEHRLTNGLSAGVGVALGKLDPVTGLFAIGGGSYMEVDGTQRMCFSIQTSQGRKWAVIEDDVIAIRECVEHANPGVPKDLAKVTMDHISKWKAPEVAQELARVRSDEVEAVGEISQRIKAAAAIDLLLSRQPDVPKVDAITVRSAGSGPDGTLGMSLLLVMNGATQASLAVVTETEATLLAEPSHDVLTKVSREEVVDHAVRHSANNLMI